MRKFCLRAVRGRSVVPKAGLAIVLCLALAVVALAAPGGIDVGFASGHSDTLQADGTSRTVLEVTLTSLSDACWGGEVSGPGTFSLLVSATKATVEPTVAVDVQFPARLTVTAGKESGTVEVKVQASWCPEDAVGAFGVCSDQSRAQSKCEAQISIPIGDAAPPAEPPKPPDRDDDGVPDADDACPDQKGKPPDGCPDFEAVLGCTPQSPLAGQKLNCSVSVQGARPGEQLNYVWYVDSTEAAHTTSPTWTWNSAVAGGHDIGVDVMGDARSLSKTVSVKVQTAAIGDDDGDAVPDDKDACRGQYGEGADGCPEPQSAPVAPPSSAGSSTGGQDLPDGSTGEQPKGEGSGGEPAGEGEAAPPPDGSDEEGEARSSALEKLMTVQQAKSPKAPAAGVAAGAVALEYIAAVLLNLRAGDRSAKQEAPAKGKEPADRSAAPSLPERSGPPRPGQAAGESAEERAKRGVQDARDYAQALEQSRKRLQELVGRVPKTVRDSENWRTRIAPLLDKVNGWTDPTKVLDLVDRLEKTLNRRQEYEKSPAYRRLNEHQREMLVWLTRGVDVLTDAAEKAHERYVIDPAKNIVEKIPGKPGAGMLEQHRKDSAGLFEEIRKAPPSTVRKVTGASQRNQGHALYPGDPDRTDDVFSQPSPPPRTHETKSDQIIRSVKEWWNRPGKLPLNR